MAAANFSRCSSYACEISSADVTIENDGSGDLLLTLLDPCNTFTNQCLIKNMFVNALKQFYVDEAVSTDGLCGTPTSLCNCTYPGDGVLTFATLTYEFPLPAGATVPPSQVTYSVVFPL